MALAVVIVSYAIIVDCSAFASSVTLNAACRAASVLQDWKMPSKPGAVPRDLQFWGGANALQAFIDVAERSHDHTFEGIVRDCHDTRSAEVVKLLGAGSFDDMLWWSLAYAEAARTLSNASGFQATAASIFEHVWKASTTDNQTCGGGVWWSAARTYKNAITNELAIATAASLHLLTGAATSTYLSRALALWEWLSASGMRSPALGLYADGLTVDPANASACASNGGGCCGGYWTYNQGVLLGALSDLHAATGNGSLLDAALVTARAVLAHLSVDSVLTELSDPPISNEDHSLFKGIYMRNLGRLVRRLPPATAAPLAQFVCRNAAAAQAAARTDDDRYSSLWAGPVDPRAPPCTQPGKGIACGNATGPAPQIAAVMLLAAAADCPSP